VSLRLLVRQFVSRWPSCCRGNGISKKFRPPICFTARRSLGYRSREIDSRFIRVDESHLLASAIHVKSNLQPNRSKDFNNSEIIFLSIGYIFILDRESVELSSNVA